MNTTTVGVDLAKHVFAVCELDGRGRVQQRRELRREAFVAWRGLSTDPRKQPHKTDRDPFALGRPRAGTEVSKPSPMRSDRKTTQRQAAQATQLHDVD